MFSKCYTIITDESQRKLGYGVPPQGHWCAACGIVRVRFDGAVAAGDLIGPNDDGNCSAMVISKLSSAPVIGFSLESKGSAEKGNLLIFLSQNPYILGDDSTDDKFRDLEHIIRDQMQNTMNILEHFSSFLSPGFEV